MQNNLQYLLTLIAISIGFGRNANGQAMLAEYLDKEVAAVAVISNPQKVWRDIGNLLKLDDQRPWEFIQQLSTNNNFGFLSAEQLDSIKNSILDFEALLTGVDEIGLVLHDLKSQNFSITIRANKPITSDLFLISQNILDQVQRIDRSKTKDSVPGERNSIHLFCQATGNWIVFSSSSFCGKELVKRIDEAKVNRHDSLKFARKYRRVAIEFDDFAKEDGAILCYGSPEKLGPLFYPNLPRKILDAYHFDEAPAIGLLIKFETNTNASDTSKPLIVFDFLVLFTEPRTGFGALMAAHKPLGELPPMPFDITDLNAFSADPFERFEATRNIIDEANGAGSYEASKQKRAKRYGRDFFSDELPKSDEVFNFRFVNKKKKRLDTVLLEKVQNKAAAEKFIQGYVNTINNLNADTSELPLFREINDDYGKLVVRHPVSESSQAYFLNEDWIISGKLSAIKQVIKSLFEDDDTSDVCKAIMEAKQTLLGRAEVFKIRFFSLWNFKPQKFENDRIREKYKRDKNKINSIINASINEHGYRLEIETPKDCQAVVMTLIAKSVAKRLGSLLFFYSNEKKGLRVRGGIFPGFNFRYTR